MRKIISKIAGLMFGLSLAMGVGVGFANHKAKQAFAADFTLSSADSITVDGITVSFDKGSGSNAPAWYSAGLRLYASNTVTVSSANNITGVTFNWEKQGSKAFASVSASVGTYSHPTAAGQGTWSGSATSIVFTLGGSGQLQLNTLSATSEGGGGETTSYAVSFDMQGHGTQVSSQTIESGEKVIEPTAPTAEGWNFGGWYKESSCENAWVFNSDTVTEPTTLFAKWTEAPASDESWVLTDIEELSEDDVFVIVGNNGSNYAMTNANGTSAPGAYAVIVSDGKITSNVTDALKWNISGDSTDGYTFYPNGSTKSWLYTTNENNGVKVGTGENKLFTIESGYLKNAATSRYVGVYNSADWRCYTSINNNIKNQTFSYYKLDQGEVVGTKVKLAADNIVMELTDSPVSIVVKNADDLTQTIAECEFSTSNASVASISEGKVVANGAGTTTITVTHEDDISDPSNPITYKSTTFSVTVVEVETIESIVKACKDLGSTADLAGTHTIKGTVTGNYSSTSKKNYMIQQGDYGMYLYDTGVDLNVGEVVRATGTFCRYKNWFEGKSFTSVVKLSEPAESITAPVISSISDLTDEYQNRVVTFKGLSYVDGTPGESDTSITFSLGGSSIILRTTAGIAEAANINAKLNEVKNHKDDSTFNLVGVHYTVYNSDKQFKVDNASKIQIVAKEATVTELVQGFVDTCMHLEDIPVSEESRESDSNACSVTGGYYEVAKAALTALGEEAIAEFKGNDIFNDAQERYESWAEIYGDATPYAAEVTPIAGSTRDIAANSMSSASTIIIVVVALTSITSIGVLLVIKRKRSLVK